MTEISSHLFNSTIASCSISAAFELGFLDDLAKKNERISITKYCKENHLDQGSFHTLLRSMNGFQIVSFDEQKETVEKGAQFQSIYENKGYFHWMVKGYGKMITNIAHLLDQKNRGENFYKRDGAAIALSGKDYGKMFVDAHVTALLDAFPFKKIADLGCGSANRLLEITKSRNCQGIGIEIDLGGVNVARDAVAKAGRSDSVQIFQGDVSQLTPQNEFKDVDLLSSFFMGHDLWPRERCVEIFKNFRLVFPNLKYFMFCDTYRSDLASDEKAPIFTLGFEVFHALMGQYIPSLSEWNDLFSEAGWKKVKEVATDIPFTHIFFLEPLKN